MTILHRNNPSILVVGESYPDMIAKYAWPGGYPLFYLTKDNEVLCPTCVQDEIEQCCDPEDNWFVVAHDANWEDPCLHCDNCSARVESAYAEEDA